MTSFKLTLAGCAMAVGLVFAAAAPAQALPIAPQQTQESAGGLKEGVINVHRLRRPHRHTNRWRYGNRHCHRAVRGHYRGYYGYNSRNRYCHRHRTRNGFRLQFNF